MATHFQDKDRKRECKANPEATCHIDEFVIGAAICRYRLRFQRHAANRTGARANLLNLRVHGAGVDRTCNNGLGNFSRDV